MNPSNAQIPPTLPSLGWIRRRGSDWPGRSVRGSWDITAAVDGTNVSFRNASGLASSNEMARIAPARGLLLWQRILRRPVRVDSRRSESRERGDTEPGQLTHLGGDRGGEEDAHEADSVAGQPPGGGTSRRKRSCLPRSSSASRGGIRRARVTRNRSPASPPSTATSIARTGNSQAVKANSRIASTLTADRTNHRGIMF